MIESPVLINLATESPILARLLAERSDTAGQEILVIVLSARFGEVPEDLAAAIRTIRGEDRLRALVRLSAVCPDLQAFRARLAAEAPSP